MTAQSNTEDQPAIQDEVLNTYDYAVVSKFLELLDDHGIVAHMYMAASYYLSRTGDPEDFVDQITDDIFNATGNPDEDSFDAGRIVDSAVSLSWAVRLVTYGNHLNVPEDLIPSTELIERCLAAFYNRFRS